MYIYDLCNDIISAAESIACNDLKLIYNQEEEESWHVLG
jgi:hypothetical protein